MKKLFLGIFIGLVIGISINKPASQNQSLLASDKETEGTLAYDITDDHTFKETGIHYGNKLGEVAKSVQKVLMIPDKVQIAKNETRAIKTDLYLQNHYFRKKTMYMQYIVNLQRLLNKDKAGEYMTAEEAKVQYKLFQEIAKFGYVPREDSNKIKVALYDYIYDVTTDDKTFNFEQWLMWVLDREFAKENQFVDVKAVAENKVKLEESEMNATIAEMNKK